MHDSDMERARSALAYLNPADRTLWVRVAFALKSEFGDAAFEVFDSWGFDSYPRPQKEVRATWKSASEGGSVTIGTLFWEAKQAGWKDDSKRTKPSAADLVARRESAERRRAEYERQEAEQHADAADRARSIWEASQPCDAHDYLDRKAVQSHGLRVGRWDKIDGDTGEILGHVDGVLMIPIMDRTRKIWSLQGIAPDGSKLYLTGGAKRGNFYALGSRPQASGDGAPIFVLGEGYATCASVHAATGHMVLVCFDTSNLLPVAKALRERLPAAVILFAADNDEAGIDERLARAIERGAHDPVWGSTSGARSVAVTGSDGRQIVIDNPGIVAARAAASAVSGLVAVPPPGDFNDLQASEGLEAVAGVIDAALGPAPAPDPDPVPPPDDDDSEIAFDDLPPQAPVASAEMPPDDVPPGDDIQEADGFAVLGYDLDEYYIYHKAKQQVIVRRRSDFGPTGLVELAPLNWWEMFFPSAKRDGGVNCTMAAEWLFGVAHRRGIYDASRTRGRGAWRDNRRMVFHHGDHLTVDGESCGLSEIKSSFVYQMARPMPALSATPATDTDGQYLLDVAKMARWQKPGSSLMLVGWAFLSPVCGSLKWRPHIWLTGPAGSGKSSIQSSFLNPLVRGIARSFQGDSTEPGIRQNLQADAIPVIIDEAEPNDEADRKRVAAILRMIRQASSESEAETAKGTVSGEGVHYHIRSMFCLASISTMLDKDSDLSRVTPLQLRGPAKSGDTEDHWPELEAELTKIDEDSTWPQRLLARALGMMPTILATVKVFTTVAAKKFGSQRRGDQFGTLVAGSWCLTRSDVPSEAEAKALLDSYDWRDHSTEGDPDDPHRALSAIMSSLIRVGTSDVTVHELVAEAAGYLSGSTSVGAEAATDVLKRHGMRIMGDSLVFGVTADNLKKLTSKTAYATDLRGQLMRLPGATNFGNKTLKFSGCTTKCVAVPLGLVIDALQASASDEAPI
jgi:putative DNA primase/helicase